jgi:hypothetical protein
LRHKKHGILASGFTESGPLPLLLGKLMLAMLAAVLMLVALL